MTKLEGIELLRRFLRGESSKEEISELHQWFNHPDHVEAVSEWMEENWQSVAHETTCEIDVDELFQNIKVSIEANEMELGLRPEDRNKQKTGGKPVRKWLQLAAGFLLPMIFFGMGYFWKQGLYQSEKVAYLQTIVPKGQKAQLVLADGTKVWLNSESEIKYPSQFDPEKREVFLKGEAFFDVTRNEEQPFWVKTDGVNVKVLGTEFNVCNYEGEDEVETTLVEGSVQLHFSANSGRSERILKLTPNQKASFNRKSSKIKLSVVDPEAYTSWKEGKLVFRSETFEQLARKLERWYDVKIYFEDEELKQYRYTGTFDRETVEQAVNALRLTSPFRYTMEKRNIYIRKFRNREKG